VCPDLRGYGQSSTPEPDAEHLTYCDRVMANDIVQLMTALGHERFGIAGHDRGSYVAYRTALDHPHRVDRLAVLDSVPVVEALERADARFAELWWHWFFFSSDQAERVITADPVAWYRPDRDRMGDESYADMVSAVSDPATVRAMLEDYRAGLHVDRGHDEADRERPSHPVSHVGRLVQVRRPGNPLWRPRGGLGPVVRATGTPCRHGLWPPHGRRGARAAGRHSRRLLRPVGSIRLTALDSEPPAR
jgi:pimeloyl-ACP methyl ester carboxylesterase